MLGSHFMIVSLAQRRSTGSDTAAVNAVHGWEFGEASDLKLTTSLTLGNARNVVRFRIWQKWGFNWGILSDEGIDKLRSRAGRLASFPNEIGGYETIEYRVGVLVHAS